MIVARIRRTLERRRLLESGERVLLACSGGPDSVAMVHAMARLAGPLSLDLVVVTIDHGLRPEASREIALVRGLAADLALPFAEERVSLGPGSVQEAAREARYEALEGLARRHRASHIAVGHTRDDQAETVLDRLLRGASISGLSGISPKRADGVIRPLIDVRRADVMAHIAHHGLDYRLDPSNQDPKYRRSRLRADILPRLAEEDPSVVDHLADLADDARATRALLRQAGQRLLKRADRGDTLDAKVLAGSTSAARREALRLFLAARLPASPRRAHIEAIDELVTGRISPKAAVLVGGGRRVYRSGAEIRLSEPSEEV